MHDKNELADFYRKADVALTLSQRETYGMTVAEALLCGTPVVGFKMVGPRALRFLVIHNLLSLAMLRNWQT